MKGDRGKYPIPNKDKQKVIKLSGKSAEVVKWRVKSQNYKKGVNNSKNFLSKSAVTDSNLFKIILVPK